VEQKKVLITGGAGDIATAARFLFEKEGYIVHAPSKSELSVDGHPFDIDKYIANYGSFNILINAAGYIRPVKFKDGKVLEFKRHFLINTTGAYNCIYSVISANPSAIIINIGSSAGTNPRKEWTGYCASKAALISMTACLADEGYKIVCVSPGRTNTKMRRRLVGQEDASTLLSPLEVGQKIFDIATGVEQVKWGDNIQMKK